MKYDDKPSLIHSVNSFLNQRNKSYAMKLEKIKGKIESSIKNDLDPDPQLFERRSYCTLCQAKINSIKTKFNVIQQYTYWRHCLEVVNNESAFVDILPSENGGHRAHREHMLQLIAHCKEIASIPYEKYMIMQSQIKRSHQHA